MDDPLLSLLVLLAELVDDALLGEESLLSDEREEILDTLDAEDDELPELVELPELFELPDEEADEPPLLELDPLLPDELDETLD